MDKETVELLCFLAQKMSGLKHFLAENVAEDIYSKARMILSDCQEKMALHCDTAPISLIAGQADEIMENLEFSKKTAIGRT